MKVFIYFCITWFSVTACNRKMSANASSPTGDTTTEIVVNGGGNYTTRTPLIPDCIQMRVDSIKQQHVWNPPAEINEYEYDGQKVYMISADCCDQFITVVDANCNYICAPSGGFTGKGDRKCVDFDAKAKHVRLIWKDERSGKK